MNEYDKALGRLRAAQGEGGDQTPEWNHGTAMFGKRKRLYDDEPHTFDYYDEMAKDYPADKLGPEWNEDHTKVINPKRSLYQKTHYTDGTPHSPFGDRKGRGRMGMRVEETPMMGRYEERIREDAYPIEDEKYGEKTTPPAPERETDYRTSADLVPTTKEEFDGKPPRAYEEEWPPASWDDYEPEGRWLYDERRYEGDPKSRTAYEYGIPEATTKYRAAMERAHLGKHPRRYNPYSGEDYDDYYADLPDYSYEAKHGINPLDNEERLRNNGSRIPDGRYHRNR